MEIAESFETIDEAELNAENESARPFATAGSTSDSGSGTAATGGSTGGGTYTTDMSCEEMFRKAGWTIASGSGDEVEAYKNFGEDTTRVYTYGSSGGITVQNESIYGELSGLYTWCEVSTQRMVVAYILNNGVSAFFFNGLGLDWTPFN